MKKIAFLGAKGGVGKTTSAMLTAAALQALGQTVTVLDTDPQGSAQTWAAYVEETGMPLKFPVTQAGSDFTEREVNSEWVIVDTPPGSQQVIDAALKWADLVILPTRPGALDMLQLTPVLRDASRLGPPAAVLLTQTRAGVKETIDVEDALREEGITLLTPQIPLRARTSRLAMVHPSARDLIASGYQDVADELKEAFSDE